MSVHQWFALSPLQKKSWPFHFALHLSSDPISGSGLPVGHIKIAASPSQSEDFFFEPLLLAFPEDSELDGLLDSGLVDPDFDESDLADSPLAPSEEVLFDSPLDEPSLDDLLSAAADLL